MAGGVVKHGREAGFTLIEIILVLILMGLLSAFLPSFFSNLQLNTAEIERERLLMLARIVHARNEALALQTERSFKIIQDGRAVQYTNLTPMQSEGTAKTENAIVSLQDVIVTCSNNCQLRFEADGTCLDPNTTLTFTSTKDSSQKTSLTINGAGYVQ